jgi:putative ABC transport system substrate-binding protein
LEITFLAARPLRADEHVPGIEPIVCPVHDPADIDGAFAAIARRAEAVIAMPNLFAPVTRNASKLRFSATKKLIHAVNMLRPWGAGMRRRQFLGALGGAAAWPALARAQSGRMRRLGVLMPFTAQDPESKARLAAFFQGLQKWGWTEGHNLRVDTCWGEGKAERYRTCAAELVATAPDVILAGSGTTVPALMQATRSISIVFVQAVDPVGSGYVASLAKPGGNITGFTQFEFSIGGKWAELLKQIAPLLTRAAVLRDASIGEGIAQFAAIQSAARPLGMELTPIGVVDPGEIDGGVTAFAASPGGGLIVTASAYTAVHRDLIVTLAARHRLPAVYPFRYFVTSGGLISYGPNPIDSYRQAAEYVHRVLNGEKPGNLPVQAATKYELTINLKMAKALGFELPPTLLARADTVIE